MRPACTLLPLPARVFAQFRAAPYRLRTATHRLPISSCGAAAKVAPHFHKAAALTCWCRSHSRMAAYLHGIRSFRVSFRSNAVAVSPLVMHISATTVNDRIMRLLALPAPLDLASVAIKAQIRADNGGYSYRRSTNRHFQFGGLIVRGFRRCDEADRCPLLALSGHASRP
jgi:hypothetical protein